MREFMLQLSYGTKVIKNLRETWIQPKTMSVGWTLCYEDDENDCGVIYCSIDKDYLKSLQASIWRAYWKGKAVIQL